MPDRDDEQPGGPDEAALAIVARHALHDEELVAALAAGALDTDEEADDRARAAALVERCPACRSLRDDVAAITGSLQAATAFTTSAPRDFRLTIEDAHRLGGTVVTRGAFGRLIRGLLGVARPLGASVAALGLVGVLVGSAVLGAAGVSQAPSADTGTTMSGAGGRSAVPAAAPSAYEGAVIQTESPKASVSAVIDAPSIASTERDTVGPGAAAWLLVISALAVVLGVLLFVAGVRATRRSSPGSAGR